MCMAQMELEVIMAQFKEVCEDMQKKAKQVKFTLQKKAKQVKFTFFLH